MTADLDGYMDFWSEDGVMELDGIQISGWQRMKEAIEGAWAISSVLHFETRAFSVNGNSLLNEFSIVWQNKETHEVSLQTGMGVIEVDNDDKWVFLRDYFDASGSNFFDSSSSKRLSAFNSKKVTELLGKSV
ncbi:nuclear transport factor 2 family protein [Endozoicomonas arenosclerae]|uniref:nuclear transport factor 2 family protein n=1 Tax=Endozoicomonas arenosclerae TaxID=1633495 RepID=UPI001560E4BD|nr:nuclear transport factor 2 family protein [Endozoicomonas arenosclerae]